MAGLKVLKIATKNLIKNIIQELLNNTDKKLIMKQEETHPHKLGKFNEFYLNILFNNIYFSSFSKYTKKTETVHEDDNDDFDDFEEKKEIKKQPARSTKPVQKKSTLGAKKTGFGGSTRLGGATKIAGASNATKKKGLASQKIDDDFDDFDDWGNDSEEEEVAPQEETTE